MNDNLAVIRELLRKHDYVVDVHLTDSGCKAIFPKRCEYPQHEPFESHYVLDSSKEYVEVFTLCQGRGLGKILMLGPHYSHKSLVMFHIIKMCNKINYNQQLIQFLIDSDVVDEGVLLQAMTYTDLSNEDLEKELALIGLAVPAFQNGFHPQYVTMAEKKEVSEGYQAVMDLFVNKEKEQDDT